MNFSITSACENSSIMSSLNLEAAIQSLKNDLGLGSKLKTKLTERLHQKLEVQG